MSGNCSSNKLQTHKITRIEWGLILSALLIVVGLLAVKEYRLAAIFTSFFVVFISVKNPACGVATVAAFFSCDQFISGVAPDTFTPGRYLIIINILFGLPLLFKDLLCKEEKYVKKQFIFYYFLIFIGGISLFWAPNKVAGFNYIFKIIVLVLWSRIAFLQLADRNVLASLSGVIAIVTSLIAVILIFGGVGRISHSSDRLLLDGLGINSIASSFGFAIVFSSFYFMEEKKLWKKALLVFSTLIIYLAIIRMGTRSIAIGIPIVFCLGVLTFSLKKVIRHVLFSFVFLGIFLTSLFIAKDHGIISDKLIQRFTGLSKVSTFVNDPRAGLAKYSALYFLNNPIGTGAGNESEVFGDFSYKIDLFESHNTFISTLVQFGLVGFLVLVVSVAFLFREVMFINDRACRFLCLILTSFFIILILKASLLQTRLYWIPLTIVFASIESCILHQKRMHSR